MSKAFARYTNEGEYPSASIEISAREWETLLFEHWIFDDENKEDFPDECYNMILVHPFTGKLFWSYTHDFDFTK